MHAIATSEPCLRPWRLSASGQSPQQSPHPPCPLDSSGPSVSEGAGVGGKKKNLWLYISVREKIIPERQIVIYKNYMNIDISKLWHKIFQNVLCALSQKQIKMDISTRTNLDFWVETFEGETSVPQVLTWNKTVLLNNQVSDPTEWNNQQ